MTNKKRKFSLLAQFFLKFCFCTQTAAVFMLKGAKNQVLGILSSYETAASKQNAKNFRLTISQRTNPTCFFFLAVRFGRVPKREKARIEAAMQQSTRNRALTTNNVWTDLEDLQHVIDTVVGAHLETCEFTRDRVREMKLRAKDSPNYTEPTRVSFRLPFSHKLLKISQTFGNQLLSLSLSF